MFHEPRFWTSLAFVLFFVIFGRKIWVAVVSKLDARADLIKGHLDEATRLRREAEQMLEDATRERDNAQQEANELIARSEAEAEALKEKALLDSAVATAQHEKQARDRIHIAEQTALREIREKATYIAIAAAQEVISEHLNKDAALSQKLVEKSIDGLSSALHSALNNDKAA